LGISAFTWAECPRKELNEARIVAGLVYLAPSLPTQSQKKQL